MVVASPKVWFVGTSQFQSNQIEATASKVRKLRYVITLGRFCGSAGRVRRPGEDSNSSDFLKRFSVFRSHARFLPAGLPPDESLLKPTILLEAQRVRTLPPAQFAVVRLSAFFQPYHSLAAPCQRASDGCRMFK
jgi:hypothetical protein